MGDILAKKYDHTWFKEKCNIIFKKISLHYLFLPYNNVLFFYFYVNVWIYCCSYVKQLYELKIRLVCTIISIFSGYQ